MLFKKKKAVEVKPFQDTTVVLPPFNVIPQISEEVVNIRTSKDPFKRTQPISPMHGTYTKDVVVIPENDAHEDIDVAYDVFRVERKLNKETEKARYGSEYHEFPSIDQTTDPQVYEKEEEKVEEKKPEFGIKIGISSLPEDAPKIEPVTTIPVMQSNFGFDEEAVENIVEDKKPIHIEEPIIPEPQFTEEAPANEEVFLDDVEDEEEDNSIPKTVITYNPRPVEHEEPIEEEESEPVINRTMPSFIQNPVQETKPEVTFDDQAIVEKEIKEQVVVQKTIFVDKYKNYKYPPMSLYDEPAEGASELPDWLEEKKQVINDTLKAFDVDGEVDTYTFGPAVTRYEIKLKVGVNVKKITQIQDNLKMALCAKSIRIEAPIPGKSNVGIEVPNVKVRPVKFKEVADNDELLKTDKPLKFALGLNIDGEPVFADVGKMPHCLIAGGTGSGKSVCINVLLVSILLHNSPADVKLILVDPKQVELVSYADLPHLLTPVINDPNMASEALKWACEEMDRRYRVFPSLRVRDIAGFNAKAANLPDVQKLEHILIVIDEFADLMMTCGQDVMDSIKRITQMGRACGIHIIVATQRPTTDVINGTIKSNIQARIAFKVAQGVDSQVILDQYGAESLLGRGDMLFKEVDQPVRIQGAYISDDEINNTCDFIRENYQPDYFFTHEDLTSKIKNSYLQKGEAEDSELIYNIAIYVVDRGTCSINNIQNTYSLGFNRASKIVDILEEMGIVSPKKGPTGREILVTHEEVDQMFKMGN